MFNDKEFISAFGYALLMALLFTLVSLQKKWILTKDDFRNKSQSIEEEILKMPFRKVKVGMYKLTKKEIILSGPIEIFEKDRSIVIIGPYYYINLLQKKLKNTEYPQPSL